MSQSDLNQQIEDVIKKAINPTYHSEVSSNGKFVLKFITFLKNAIVGLIATFIPIFALFYFRAASVMTEELAVQTSQRCIFSLAIILTVSFIIYRSRYDDNVDKIFRNVYVPLALVLLWIFCSLSVIVFLWQPIESPDYKLTDETGIKATIRNETNCTQKIGCERTDFTADAIIILEKKSPAEFQKIRARRKLFIEIKAPQSDIDNFDLDLMRGHYINIWGNRKLTAKRYPVGRVAKKFYLRPAGIKAYYAHTAPTYDHRKVVYAIHSSGDGINAIALTIDQYRNSGTFFSRTLGRISKVFLRKADKEWIPNYWQVWQLRYMPENSTTNDEEKNKRWKTSYFHGGLQKDAARHIYMLLLKRQKIWKREV